MTFAMSKRTGMTAAFVVLAACLMVSGAFIAADSDADTPAGWTEPPDVLLAVGESFTYVPHLDGADLTVFGDAMTERGGFLTFEDGVLSGTATTAGTYLATVRADVSGDTVAQVLKLIVADGKPVWDVALAYDNGWSRSTTAVIEDDGSQEYAASRSQDSYIFQEGLETRVEILLADSADKVVADFDTWDGLSVRASVVESGANAGKVSVVVAGTPSGGSDGDEATLTLTILKTDGSTVVYAVAFVYATSIETSIAYDANGGTGAPEADSQSTTSVTGNSHIFFTVSSVKPVRSGYTFLGWSTSQSNAATIYSAGTSYAMPAGTALTFYAVWQKSDEATYAHLEYNANGGTGAPATQEERSDSSIISESASFKVSTEAPVREGYGFVGWALEADAASAAYHAGDSISVSFGDTTTLYAVWSKTVSLSYSLGPGSDGPSDMKHVWTGGSDAASFDFTVSEKEPVWSAGTFLGWSEDSGATAASIEPGATVKAAGDITLYAVWTADVTVWYAIGPGQDGGLTSRTVTWTGATDPIVSFRISVLSSEGTGCTFLGWSLDANDAKPPYQYGDSISVPLGSSYATSITLYGIWTKEVKLAFNANGGSGAPSTMTGTGTSSTAGAVFTVPSTIPARSGYAFAGWSVSSESASAQYAPGGTIAASEDTVLYAVWVQVGSDTVRVSYNANGGTGAPDAQTSETGVGTATMIVAYDIPTRAGYTFAGWSTFINASGATYQPGAEMAVPYGSTITLYAVWTADIVLSFNGTGTGIPGASTVKWTGGSAEPSATFTIPSVTPTRSGYAFEGWSVRSEYDGGSLYHEGDSVTVSSSTVLHAVWSKAVTLSYDAGSGKGAPYGGTVVWIGASTPSVTFDVPTSTPRWSGYTFVGWAVTARSASASYLPGGEVTIGSDTVLHAVWTKTIGLTYSASGATDVPGSQTSTWTGSYGVAGVTMTVSPDIPSMEGFTFDGWSLDGKHPAAYSAGDSISLIADATLYAVWTPVESESGYHAYLMYDADSGTGAPEEQTASSTLPGTASFQISSDAPAREGYTFKGWSTSSTEYGTLYQPGSVIAVDYGSSVTLYAIWTKQLTLDYYTGSGTSVPAAQTSTWTGGSADAVAVFSISVATPEYGGLTFMGWTVDGSAATYLPGETVTVGSDTTLRAVWSSSRYTVVFESNGGAGTMDAQTFDSGIAGALTANAFTRDGYTFIGWSADASIRTPTYADGETVVDLASENGTATLYAVWKANTYRVVFDANGGTGEMDAEDFTYGVPKALTANTFAKEGSFFLGWSLNSTAGAATYKDGQSVSRLTIEDGRTVTLYAVWTTQAYTVVFDPNGGAGTMDAQTFVSGISQPLSLNKFARDGYHFMGWSRTSYATVATYSDGETVLDITTEDGATVTLYAVWSGYTYTVSFDSTGGKGTMQDQVFTYGVTKSLPVCTFTRDGYSFQGWTTDPTSAVVMYSNGMVVYNLSNEDRGHVTLYAIWKSTAVVPGVTEYTVSIIMEDGSVTRQTVTDGSKAVKLENPDGRHYVYYTDAAHTSQYTFGAVSSDLTLYAVLVDGVDPDEESTVPMSVPLALIAIGLVLVVIGWLFFPRLFYIGLLVAIVGGGLLAAVYGGIL